MMAQDLALTKIEKEIERLTPQEQLKLVERLAHNLRMTGVPARNELDWNEIYGIGKGLWKGEDAQSYVNRVREDRE